MTLGKKTKQDIILLAGFFNRFKKVFRLNGIAITIFLAGTFIFARILGPVEYGKISLINNISMFLLVLINLGTNQVMYKQLPLTLQNNADNKQSLISSAVVVCILSSIITSILFSVFFIFTGKLIGLTISIWGSSIIVSLIINLYSLSESFLRGQKRFKEIGFLQILNSSVFLAACFIILFLFNIRYFWTYLIAFFIARFVFIIPAIYKNHIKLSCFTVPIGKKILKYGIYIMGNLFLGNLILAGDVLTVNYFYPGASVGIYSAYKGAGILLFSVLFYEIFSVVFLPYIADKHLNTVLIKIALWSPVFFILYSAFSGIIITVYVYLLGRAYKLDMQYILLTSVLSSVYALYQLINHSVNSGGREFADLSFRITAAFLIPAFVLLVMFVRAFGLIGAFVSMSIIYFVLLVLIFSFSLRKAVRNI